MAAERVCVNAGCEVRWSDRADVCWACGSAEWRPAGPLSVAGLAVHTPSKGPS